MESWDSELWREHLADSLSASQIDALMGALHDSASVSIRLNPFKRGQAPEGAQRVPWSEWGYLLRERPCFTLDPLFHAGTYYVQDSSSMFVGYLFRELLSRMGGRRLRVLDLCAAPGGKSTDLAASLRAVCGDDFLLVSNEIMRQRAAVLSDNIALWGDPNVVVTSCDPRAFARFEGIFDIILTDVPCSGEGMFRKDAQAVRDWSVETVSLCAQRQRRILADVWPSLKEGGLLLYSTCTFERAENDDCIQWICEQLGGEPLCREGDAPFEGIIKTPLGYLLLPGYVPGEGQYCSAICKTSATPISRYSEADLKDLRPLRWGVPKGTIKGRDTVPNPDWALSISYDRDAYPMVELDRQTALKFLHRDTIILPDAPRGYIAITYEGHPLGFVKNLGSRCNNLHPQGRRILMDISRI